MSGVIQTVAQTVRFQVFSVAEWPDVNPFYAHILVQLPDGYEFRLSETDAQRLGNALNRAGGGSS